MKESLQRYKKYVEKFDLNEDELMIFLCNYYDAVAFNNYLFHSSRYSNFDFNSDDNLLKLIDFFEGNNIDKKTAKEVFISMPMILYCDDLEKDLDLIYKGDDLEGILIYDEEGNCYPYRRIKDLGSIMQNYSLLEELEMNKLINKSNCKKIFNTKKKK